jgi:hypothetical protein
MTIARNKPENEASIFFAKPGIFNNEIPHKTKMMGQKFRIKLKSKCHNPS